MTGTTGGRTLRAVLTLALVVLVVLVWGGYVEGWSWTGLSRSVKLWDWLEALALPMTVALVPLLVRHRQHLHRRHAWTGLTVLAAFAVLVLLGYVVPWRWTGFTGNTLWDWLSLALLPLAIATSTLWPRPERWTRRHWSWLTTGAVLAAVLVAAGYLVPWGWTGFTGNTAWDWVKLLLVPVLLPTLVLPRLVDATETWMRRQHAEDGAP